MYDVIYSPSIRRVAADQIFTIVQDIQVALTKDEFGKVKTLIYSLLHTSNFTEQD